MARQVDPEPGWAAESADSEHHLPRLSLSLSLPRTLPCLSLHPSLPLSRLALSSFSLPPSLAGWPPRRGRRPCLSLTASAASLDSLSPCLFLLLLASLPLFPFLSLTPMLAHSPLPLPPFSPPPLSLRPSLSLSLLIISPPFSLLYYLAPLPPQGPDSLRRSPARPALPALSPRRPPRRLAHVGSFRRGPGGRRALSASRPAAPAGPVLSCGRAAAGPGPDGSRLLRVIWHLGRCFITFCITPWLYGCRCITPGFSESSRGPAGSTARPAPAHPRPAPQGGGGRMGGWHVPLVS